MPEDKKDKSSLVFLSKYFFLLALIVIAVNQFLQREIINNIMPEITIVAIALGFLTFYAHKERVEKELEDEKGREESAETKRKAEFDSRFPHIAKLNLGYGFRDAMKNYKGLKRAGLIKLRVVVAPFVFLIRLPYKLLRWMYYMGWSFSIPFVLITIAFIAIKIGMPIVYTGSYIDEYNHILSGVEFFKTGHFAEIYKGEYYNRGAYVSFLVGLFMYLFGQTIFVAKMVPAMIGIINFFLLYSMSKRIFSKKSHILILLLVYSMIPWFIFNHFYIRMYVFYEFFMLTLTLLFILVIEEIKNIKKVKVYSIFIIITIGILYFFSYDSGKYLVLFYSFIFLTYIFFFEINHLSTNNKTYQGFKDNTKLKIGIFLFIIIILFLIFNPFQLMEEFFSGTLTATSGGDHKYDNLFFSLNFVFTILFLSSMSSIFLKKTKSIYKILLFSSFTIFLIHYNSSLDLQITRAIIYFLPLFYLISIFSFSNFTKIYKNKILIFLLIILVAFSVYLNYPNKFFSDAPNIPTEIVYRDYKKAIDYSKIFVDNETTIITNLPHIYRFYNQEIDNEIYLLRDKEQSFYDDRLRYSNDEEIYYYTPSNDLIITNSEMLSKISMNENVILILDQSLYSTWITPESRQIIQKDFKINGEFERINTYEKNENSI